MNNHNKYIHSILPSNHPKIYPQNIFSNKESLEKELRLRGLDISLHEALKGGFFSQVYAAILDGKPVVVKHVGSLTPFDPTEFYISDKQFLTDVKVLKLLKKSQNIHVPCIITSIPKIRTVILEDMRQSGFTLMNDQIVGNKFQLSSAKSVGSTLARFVQESKNWKQFKTNESAEQNIYERGLELRLLYPNSQAQYQFLESEYTRNNAYFCWPDGHPKNIFVNADGKVAFIDFGRGNWADQRYILPNFLAHIIMYGLAGHIQKDLVKKYVLQVVKEYRSIEKINESLFCQYLAMEVIHRAAGKWVAEITTKDQKLALYGFGLTIFDKRIETIDQLLAIF